MEKDEGAGDGVEYFMIRIHPHRTGNPPLLTGAIERLGTGEKLGFTSGEDLLRLLGSWPEPAAKMHAEPGPGNPSDTLRSEEERTT
jgi:hypothetical protein